MNRMVQKDFKPVALFGDCLKILPSFEDDSIDAVVTDPPYHLTSIVKRFGAVGLGDDTQTSERGRKRADGYARLSTGFMGKQWDGGDIAQNPALWAEVLRVLKPGGHMVAFSGTRTYHRMACAIEDAGFEIRDQLAWVYGQGFPKSLDVSKAIDKAAGAEREIVGSAKYRDIRNGHGRGLGDGINASARSGPEYIEHNFTAPATDAARQWSGWGTALKPAWEPICLARKPLSEPTVADNVLRWGTGALNIDATRIAASADDDIHAKNPHTVNKGSNEIYGEFRKDGSCPTYDPKKGRWPANLCHDGSQEVLDLFPETKSGAMRREVEAYDGESITGFLRGRSGPDNQHGDSGSAARFFYCAKASKADRAGSKHPTVKPVALKRWLCRMVCPPGGTILDMFAGTGTTGQAALEEGFYSVLIENEKEYFEDLSRRLDLPKIEKGWRQRR